MNPEEYLESYYNYGYGCTLQKSNRFKFFCLSLPQCMWHGRRGNEVTLENVAAVVVDVLILALASQNVRGF